MDFSINNKKNLKILITIIILSFVVIGGVFSYRGFIFSSVSANEVDQTIVAEDQTEDQIEEKDPCSFLKPKGDETIDYYKLIDLFNEERKNLAQLNRDYLGIAVTIILATGGFFYLVNFLPLREKIKEIEAINKRTKDNEEAMRKELDFARQRLIENRKEQEKLRKESVLNLKNQEIIFKAETSRSLALHSENLKIWNKAFYWWIDAAYHFYKYRSPNKIVLTSIITAGETLNKIEKRQIERLEKELPRIEEKMEELKEKYPQKIKEIGELIAKKLSAFKEEKKKE